MKKTILGIVLVMISCAPAQTPIPVPPTATQIINQYPTLLPTPTLAVNTRHMEEEDKEEAFNFFYELKNQMALGEFEHFAEEIRYPIRVNLDGQPRMFVFVAEFELNFEKIFSEKVIQKFISTDESELTFTSDGVKVADGIIWFDLICTNPTCDAAEFMITEINN